MSEAIVELDGVIDDRSVLHTGDRAKARLRRRHRSEVIFRFACRSAIVFAVLSLVALLTGIAFQGAPAFTANVVALDVQFDAARLGLEPGARVTRETLADYPGLAKEALRQAFPDVTSRRDKRALYRVLSTGASSNLRDALIENPAWLGTTQRIVLPLSADADLYLEGRREVVEGSRGLQAIAASAIDTLVAEGRVERVFNATFFTSGDSREPELAGILGALVGSLLTIVVSLAISFPLGVGAAVHLEEFARPGRFNEFVEVNINNLGAVPSIIFGLLGLAVFLGFFDMPRSAPVVGGFVLALMTLPTIIIAARAALRAVPPSIRSAALALGASPVQVVLHHVLPLALPGILTGTILGVARALGETAPLLLIGMVAFVVDVPSSFTDPSTVLPVQIFLWADSPERAFVERTAAAIGVLLIVLMAMNLGAVLLRQRFERKW